MGAVDNLLRPGSFDAAARAYRMAGRGPADVDMAEVYDSFTITALLGLEALGFCAPGAAADFVADGRLRPGGALPFNTDGGGLSYAHPAMQGLLLLVEAVRQLRGECGDRQVADPEAALAHGTGGVFSTHATVLLGRDGRGGW